MLKDPNVEQYVADAIKPLQKQIKELKAEIETLKQAKSLHLQVVCDNCGSHPTIIYQTTSGRFCEKCKPYKDMPSCECDATEVDIY